MDNTHSIYIFKTYIYRKELIPKFFDTISQIPLTKKKKGGEVGEQSSSIIVDCYIIATIVKPNKVYYVIWVTKNFPDKEKIEVLKQTRMITLESNGILQVKRK